MNQPEGTALCPAFAVSAHGGLSREWQAEWAVGKKLAEEIEKEETIIGDPSLTQYLNDLEQTLVTNSHLRGCFVVKLIHDVEANAYSLPGGFSLCDHRADADGSQRERNNCCTCS